MAQYKHDLSIKQIYLKYFIGLSDFVALNEADNKLQQHIHLSIHSWHQIHSWKKQRNSTHKHFSKAECARKIHPAVYSV